VAVIQISKIQVRRGKKNSNSGIPQLSSAEFAWALDSQELFIGNGSVADGAPYVGNTKILTEHDNILELAGSYRFGDSDFSITASQPRSLQGKLDEYVSILDFVPTELQDQVRLGTTDCVSYFEIAFTQLFRGTNSNYKKVLTVPNGTYLFLSDLALPDGVILRGETQQGAILNINSHNIRFITSTGLEITNPLFNSTNRPKNINLSNLTILRTAGQVVLSGTADSLIERVTFKGNYNFGDSVDLSTAPSATVWENRDEFIFVNNLKFKDCLFESNGIAVRCNQTILVDTQIKFENTKFLESDTAIYITGVEGQGNKWQINDCEFEEIANQAFRATYGRGTLIQKTKFKNVGNTTNLSLTPTDYIVYFGESINNSLIDCTSDRQQRAGVTSSNLITAYSEVYNGDKVNFVDRIYSPIALSDAFQPLAVFSANNKFTILNYCLRLSDHVRHGQLWISIGDDLSGTELDNPLALNTAGNVSDVTITDNFQYSPRFTTSNGGALMTNFEFAVELRDNDTDSGIETLVLSYKNPLPGAPGSISFDVTYGV
jgi:hypothetical protein